MKNTPIFFNKFIAILLLVLLSGQSIAFAQELQQQSQPRIGYDGATGKVSFIGAESSSQDNQPTDTATVTPTPTETPLAEKAETSTLPIITEQTPKDQNLIQPNEVGAFAATIYYVNINAGNDTNTCTSVALPCQHIQEAINKTSNGDSIQVTADTYVFSTNPTPNVIIITKSLNISGGWNSAFTSQVGASVVDGANINNGVLANAATIVMEGFVIQNGSTGNGGGIYVVNGNFTIKNSTLKNNHADGNGGGIFLDSGNLTAVNTTISSNNAGLSGGGIYASQNNGVIASIQNSTIAYNIAQNGGGISRSKGAYTIVNTIIANNIGIASNPDCNGTISTVNYSIIENMSGCTITTASNNLNVDPQIDGNLTGNMLTHMLLIGSPAINAGTASGCPSTDQRGFARPQGSGCDIGSIEYIGNGTKSINILSGSNQESSINTAFFSTLVVLVLDENDSPVSGVNVTFTAPASGASGLFSVSSTNTTTVNTGANGVAATSTFTANGTIGSYTVTASASGYTSVVFQLSNTPVFDPNGRYVSPTGSDAEPTTCNSPVAPCLTIDKAIQSAVAGNTIYVAAGTYATSSGAGVVINKGVALLGGWDTSFTAQIGRSIIDGQRARRGVLINVPCCSMPGSLPVVIDHFKVQNGAQSGSFVGGGIVIYSAGKVTISNGIISGNSSESSGGGISTQAEELTISNTTISENTSGQSGLSGGGGGAGINISYGKVTLNNSSVVNNNMLGFFNGSGIYNAGELIVNNSTIVGNTGAVGVYQIGYGPGITFHNSIVSKNTPLDLSAALGEINISDHNLIGIDPKISPSPIGPLAFYFLLPNSPAIDAGNPATCLLTDQRGVMRPQGAGCDIGAFEYMATPGPIAYFGTISGSNQSGYIGNVFPEEMAVYVADSLGNPINGVEVTFSAPRTGASVVFANSSSKDLEMKQSDFARHSNRMFTSKLIYETTAATVNGIAKAPPFKANFQVGSYIVTASISELAGSASFSLANLPISNQPNFLHNGNFEDPIQGNHWDTYSSNYGTPLCTFSKCGNGGGTAGPRSGNTWVWFGGTPVYMESGYISQQDVIIPSGPARLRFYLWIGYAQFGSNSNDKLTVILNKFYDNIVLFTTDATQKDLYSSYKLVEIDLSPYADKTIHSIRFEAQTNGKVVNFNLDDISINAATFGDVPPDYWSWNWIERLYNAGITSGCTSAPVTYCPDNTVTRAQMAVFLLKGMHGSSYTPPAVGVSSGFADVATNYWAAPWIKQLAAEGITGGCGNGNYCPDATVTRAQMAIFLLRAKHGSSYSPPAATGVFTDVPVGYWADKWIEQLAVEGVTSGCGGTNYCPDSSVTRAQMAVFLVKAFNLP